MESILTKYRLEPRGYSAGFRCHVEQWLVAIEKETGKIVTEDNSRNHRHFANTDKFFEWATTHNTVTGG